MWDDYWKARSEKAKFALVEIYYPLLLGVAKAVVRKLRNEDIGDLLGNGTVGLLDAIQKYVPWRNVRFENYAARRIRGAMLDGLRRDSPIPRGYAQGWKVLEGTRSRLEQSFFRPVREDEIRKASGMSEEKAKAARRAQLLLHAPEEDAAFHPDRRGSGPDISGEFAEVMRLAKVHLSRRSVRALFLRFRDGLTAKATGKRMRLSESRVCQIVNQSILRLRGILLGSA